MEETSPLVEAIVQAVQTCLTVAKHTENAKVYNQKRKKNIIKQDAGDN